MQRSPFLFWAALAGFFGVAMGAFGAHGLKNILSEHMLEVYKTAVSYQIWHALALGLVAVLPPSKYFRWAAFLLLAGIVLFSGSLYGLAIFNIAWLGIITPFGGVAFLLAWGLIAYAALQNNME
jgi:uncharacterized membrane protein YgdD (TMEM256/DUF423 family)